MSSLANRADPMREALERLLDALGEAESRRALRETGRRIAQLELERVIARRFAVRLLNQRAPRSVVRDRLVSRGVNWRTAYRVIDAALNTRARDPARKFVSEPPALATAPPNILPIASLEEPMPSSLAQLHTDLSAVKSKFEMIGLQAARANEAKARQAVEALKADRARQAEQIAQGQQAPITVVVSFDQEMQSALQVLTGAKRQASDAEIRARPLIQEIERLERLLSGEQRVARSKELLASVQKMDGDAADQVKEAEDAVAAIDRLIETEVGAYESARKGAAAKLLAIVKAKGDTSQVPAATREKIATMEFAKAEAQSELDAARAALDATQRRVKAARKDLRTAQADVTELAHEFALTAYTEALARHMAAHWRAHGTGFRPKPAVDEAQIVSETLLAESEAS